MTAALDLDAIEARANAATKGPWAWQANDKGYPQQIVGNDDGLVLVAETFTGPEHFPAEAEFIAHARTDVPALIAALREAQIKLNALRGQAEMPLLSWEPSSVVDTARKVGWDQARAAILRILDGQGVNPS